MFISCNLLALLSSKASRQTPCTCKPTVLDLKGHSDQTNRQNKKESEKKYESVKDGLTKTFTRFTEFKIKGILQ